MDNYVIFHLHTMLSNPITNIDSVNNYKEYVDRAKELNMKAIAFSEHGNIFNWFYKKKYTEENGLKYIHAVEAYVTNSFKKKERDNYHVILIAKNYAGFKELNTLVSKSFNRSNTKTIDEIERFYYQPRISFDELINTSDNIIITTACLNGILNSNNKLYKPFVDFLKDKKHRCFLEIQHHNVKEQKEYNLKLYELNKTIGVKLISGTDTHSLNDEYAEGRIVLQKAKKTYFDNEEGWDLNFKTYDELVQSYKNQNVLPEKVYLEAIQNTNLLADMVEEFEIDKSHKYPEFSKTPREDIYKIINKEINDRKINVTEEIKQRIDYEIDTYEHNKASNLLLLEYDIKRWARENNIAYGDSRGSISGSYVAYLMKITNVDSIKHNLSFERFMNKERVSLADIDTDWSYSQRDLVKRYLHENNKYYTAEIITFNTIDDKGAIRDVGRALEIPLTKIDRITKTLEICEDKHRQQYPKLFKYVDLLKGTVVSMGSHPAATICSPITLYDSIGTVTLSNNDYPVSCLNMKEIDDLNFVKLDVLGLKTIEIIAKTCELAGIERLTSDNVDDEDEKVWQDILKSPLSIFEFESSFAHSYLRKVLSSETIEKIRKKHPNVKRIDLMSMANGAIRPAGDSYREALSNGEFKNNGHEVLNDFLKNTNGFLVYQEQVIDFLHKFCGFTMGEADIIRRGFAKKTGTEQYIPKIKNGFIKTMQEKYNTPKEKAEEIIESFLKVIEDASSYLFSLNHSLPYSYIGYICGWLRYYYPLEFLTVILNVNEDNQDKTAKILDYIKDYTNIKVKPARFRYSKEKYMMDKESNSIYKGISSIKFCNKTIAEELYNLRNNQYGNFVELLYDIAENTSINMRQLDILIKLDFFSEFGNARLLNGMVEYFDMFKQGKAKQISVDKTSNNEVLNNIVKRHSRLSPSGKTYMELNVMSILEEIEEWMKCNDVADYTIVQKIKFHKEYLGYIGITTERKEDRKKLIILSIRPLISQYRDGEAWAYAVETMSIGSGKKSKLTIWAKTFDRIPLNIYDVVYADKVDKNNKGYWYLLNYHKIKI